MNKYNISHAIPILYSFRRCPYAMRARMALKYAQIDYQHREILLNNKPLSLLEYSAKGTVPILIVNGCVIDESLDIMQWALQQRDENAWLVNVQQFDLIQLCDNKFKGQLDCYKYADRYELTESEYRQQALWYLQLLDEKLNQDLYLMNDKISLADIAIFPFIRQFAFVDKSWFDNSAFIKLQSWLQNLLESELFQSIMHKYPLWIED